MNVEFINFTQTSILQKSLEVWIKRVQKSLIQRKTKFKKVYQDYSLTIVFVTEQRSQRLNKLYRQRNYPTDVLSFPGSYRGHIGDLVLCPKVIKKQAKTNNWSYKRELAYMVLHGLLHLVGYDHEKNQKQAKTMFTLQDDIFQRLYKGL